MSVRAPHFLLFSEAKQKSQSTRRADGQWRFVLESVDGEEKIEAIDSEPEVQGDRLELLAVVRGLEALDQPSRVTLVTRSRYVSRGLRFGLDEWRETGWKWEHFGELTPVKNDDLWRRVDHAMKYHHVECRTWRFDSAHADSRPAPEESSDVVAPHEQERSSNLTMGDSPDGESRSAKPSAGAKLASRLVGRLSGLLYREKV